MPSFILLLFDTRLQEKLRGWVFITTSLCDEYAQLARASPHSHLTELGECLEIPLFLAWFVNEALSVSMATTEPTLNSAWK